MTRQQRRAAEREQVKRPAIYRTCDHANLARAIAMASQAGQPGIAELLREIGTGTFGLIYASDRAAIVTPADLAYATLPTVALVGDDDDTPSGPAGWACAPAITEWAAAAVIHAAAASAETYGEAIRGARVLGSCALIETSTLRAHEWATLFAGKPALLILPKGGVHPVNPPRSAMQ